MAINIFQGGKTSNNKVNSASNSKRVADAKAALKSTNAAVSDAGNTAVKKESTLSKVGNFVGKAAGVVSKFLPGIGGTIAKGISSIFNDPEWWQSVPGDALTANVPLRTMPGELRNLSGQGNHEPFVAPRGALLEFVSVHAPFTEAATMPLAIYVNDNMVTQYLMPEIRKVVNAVPLQTAEAYKTVLSANTTLYALWRQLVKWDYILKHGTTFMSNWNDHAYPILRTSNAAWLQSTINRIEEYLRANVRLPHTLCEYLAWRYGRMYRSNDSAKAAFVSYDVLSIDVDGGQIDTYEALIRVCMDVISGSSVFQQANTDIYNAYYDHDLQVVISEESQARYDKKEFLLRTNLDVGVHADYDRAIGRVSITTTLTDTQVVNSTSDIFITDSNLDNPTTFMSSSVSTLAVEDSGSVATLFPVESARIYIPTLVDFGNSNSFYDPTQEQGYPLGVVVTGMSTNDKVDELEFRYLSPLWQVGILKGACIGEFVIQSGVISFTNLGSIMLFAGLAKSVDFYNYFSLTPNYRFLGNNDPTQISTARRYDMSTLSIDEGLPTDRTVGIEQVYALANLVNIGRKTSGTYKQAEAQVAKDTANLIDKLDVATIKS